MERKKSRAAYEKVVAGKLCGKERRRRRSGQEGKGEEGKLKSPRSVEQGRRMVAWVSASAG